MRGERGRRGWKIPEKNGMCCTEAAAGGDQQEENGTNASAASVWTGFLCD